LSGEHSSTLKNAGGVRATWRNRANVQLCKYSINFYETLRDEIQFRQLGYYWLHDEQSLAEIEKNLPLYNEYGLNVKTFMPEQIKRFLPFVDNLEGVAGLSVSKQAGLIDHYSLREYYRKKAKSLGVEFVDRCYVKDVELSGGGVKSVIALYVKGMYDSKLIKKYLMEKDINTPHKIVPFSCEVLINTAGAWSPKLSKLYGFLYDDIKPRRRQMLVINNPDVDLSAYGMIIDTSDVYFHKEGTSILAGYSNFDEPYGYNFDVSFNTIEENSPFVKYIWEPLWNRMSSFEKIKLIRGWAGIYGETPDRSGYIGKVPGLENVYECAGHTGRGLMISYGAGQALADLIIDGKFRPDLKSASDFSRERPSGELFEELHL
ncbi:MAG: FAD-binding oxidoreductase, partial [Candidatus Dadabacteria bacterium]|nr:FAD-binding oxidoreductase [Candidatus Dadabacteria bacterium]NIS10190.1 FAD-binding oxidoreductase [Candidatus Dadabacteria bacterium]NIV42625.1 FAD-dependent oxidoreductase [Candidatus Dadabacteria bacterium]NIX16556.1 FAD-dependent oxidoreductase [Candidatus Dadabacteria bacterium]NIY23105.1 FAD-dependent oxidoreductase [Candidatus Dadabacteria bacterium]